MKAFIADQTQTVPIGVKRAEIHLNLRRYCLCREQRGTRPVLVISPAAFNKFFFEVPISGIGTTGFVRCDQLRTIDLESRDAHQAETRPDAILAGVLARVAPIFRSDHGHSSAEAAQRTGL